MRCWRGEKIDLCVTKCFKDLLQIGNQARHDIFDIVVAKQSNLYEEMTEVDERVELAVEKNKESENDDDSWSLITGVSGELLRVVKLIDEEALKPFLKGLLDKGISCLAVVLMHAYTYPNHEMDVEKLALELGFRHVFLSSNSHCGCLSNTCDQRVLIGFHLQFDDDLGKVNVLFMQSESRFPGHKAVLLGPAGEVVGYSRTLFGLETGKLLIGFDMGDTSTDVSGSDGSYEQVI